MNNPLVSVLMTAYNREKYIAEAIESVINSTYQNWELIIVDDVSSDRTVEIAKSYEAKDQRIKVYVNEKNLGDYPNRNKAASYAKGKYLKYVDADDMIYQNCLEIMIKGMEDFENAAFGLIATNSLNFNGHSILALEPNEIYNLYLNGINLLSRAPTSIIFQKEIFFKIKGFKNVRHFGDADLLRRLSLKYSIIVFKDNLVFYRKHSNQENVKNKKNKLLPIIAYNSFTSHLFNFKNRINHKLAFKIFIKYKKIQFSILANTIVNQNYSTAFKQFKLIIINEKKYQ